MVALLQAVIKICKSSDLSKKLSTSLPSKEDSIIALK